MFAGKEILPSLQSPTRLASSVPHPSRAVPSPQRLSPEFCAVQPTAGPIFSTFVSGRTLGFVRLLLSIPLVQLRAA